MGTPPVKAKPRGFSTVGEYGVFEESVEKELKCLKVCQIFQKRPHQCIAVSGKVFPSTHLLLMLLFERP